MDMTTDSNGQITFTVTSTTAGIVTYTATDTGQSVTLNGSAQVTFMPGQVSASQSTITANPASVTADGSTPSTITVTLLDANNNPVGGVPVMVWQEGWTSNISPDNWTNTDANGQAVFTVTSTTAGTVTYGACYYGWWYSLIKPPR